eukprot:NODE_350_length_8989_cov_0.477684.p4 type:complete len:321 gc:universal NODE_350_length_8989_cov_0.477684:8190-7228(-)
MHIPISNMYFPIITAFQLIISPLQIDVIQVTLINPSDAPVTIMTANTPFSGLREDVLQIHQNGNKKDFFGQHVHWNYDDLESITTTIQPHQSLTQSISISKRYNTFHGNVELFAKFPLRICTASECSKPQIIQSNSISTPVIAFIRHKRAIQPTFTMFECTPNQLKSTRYAIAEYPKLLDAALINLHSKDHTKSIQYFGVNANIKHVQQIYTKSKSHKFDVTCADAESCGSNGVYAFVYPNESDMLYVCNQFFKTNSKGWDSKPGVFVHELSHFLTVGGTDDIEYGKDEAIALAIEDPLQAVNNADNYEYFAESVYFKLN